MTWQFALKTLITVALVLAISGIAKRSSFWAAVLASLPPVSVPAFVWLYMETGSAERAAPTDALIVTPVADGAPGLSVLRS
jgi:hypothetical protein